MNNVTKMPGKFEQRFGSNKKIFLDFSNKSMQEATLGDMMLLHAADNLINIAMPLTIQIGVLVIGYSKSITGAIIRRATGRRPR